MTDNQTNDYFITGWEGEEAVADILLKRGYKVKPGPEGGPDLILEGCITVEVKTAHLSTRADSKNVRWQFCLFKDDGEHEPFNEDILILRCLTDPPYHFIIPGELVYAQLTKIDITRKNPKKYLGRWHAFGEKWILVDMVVAWVLWSEGKIQ